MATGYLIGVAIVAIIVLLLLVTWLKWPAYIALLAVSVGTAIAAGVSLPEVIPIIIDGMGSTLGSVALLVGLGAMLGGIVEKTGAAASLAEGFKKKLGEKRVGIALLLASAVIAIPIFYDVAFIILVPIIYSFAKAAGHKNPLILGLPIAPFMVYLHNTLPPHPGITAATVSLEGDIGLMLLVGLVVAVPVGFVAFIVARMMNLREYVMTAEAAEHFAQVPGSIADAERSDFGESHNGSKAHHGNHGDAVVGDLKVATATKVEPRQHKDQAPSVIEVLFCILLPILMIAVGTVGSLLLPDSHPALEVTSFVGAPAFALLVAAVVAYYLLGVRRGHGRANISQVMDDALGPAAVVVFVTGAGGVFAAVLTQTGIGKAISESLLATGLHILPLAFLLAAAFKVSQGSGTVAAQTTGGLLAATVLAGDYSSIQVVLLLIAIGCGSNSLTHVNDSAFWITTRYLGLSVVDGLKTWSVLGLVLALTGFAATTGLWAIVS